MRRCNRLILHGMFIGVVFSVTGQGDAQPAMPVESSNVRVVCIGINGYRDDCVAKLENGQPLVILPDLKYAEADAYAMKKLIDEQYGYQSHIVVGADATRERIQAEVRWLKEAGSVGAGIFYFSGHGCTANDIGKTVSRRGAYIIPAKSGLKEEVPAAMLALAQTPGIEKGGAREPRAADALTPEALEKRAILIQDVVKELEGTNLRHAVIIIDACCAGYQLDGVNSRGSADETRYQSFSLQSRTILTAGTDTQAAQESVSQLKHQDNPYLKESTGHGWFTEELVSTLSASGNAITTNELHMAVHEGVHDRSGGIASSTEMLPQRRSTGSGSFVWVKQPTQKWLEQVEKQVNEHQTPIVGNGKGDGGSGNGPARPGGSIQVPKDRPVRPGVAAAPVGKQKFASLAAQLDDVSSSLDLLCVATEAAKIHSGREDEKQKIGKDPRWIDLRRRCVLKASGGDPDAMSALYYAYNFGIAVPEDQRVAKSWAANGADTRSEIAEQVYRYSMASGGDAGVRSAKEQEQREQTGSGLAMTGALIAIHGASQGDNGSVFLGLATGVLGFITLSNDLGVAGIMDQATKSRDVFRQEIKKNESERDVNRLMQAVDSLGIAAQKCGEFNPLVDPVDSPFRHMSKNVATQLIKELAAYKDASKRDGRTEGQVLTEIDRRFDELVALYASRCAMIDEQKKKNSSK